MMIYLIGVPTLIFLTIVQSTVLSQLTVLDGRPDLVLLVIVAWALTGRAREALTLGFIGGVFHDLFSGFPLGVSAISLVVVAYLVSLSEGRFWGANMLLVLGAVLLSSVVYHSFSLGMLWITGRGVDLPYAIGRFFLPSLFLNLVLALPVTQLAEGLRESLFPPKVEV